MRELRPYKTVNGALRSLDNGGRFFNLFAQAGDEVVNAAELARSAGIFSGTQAILHFEMALMDLQQEERRQVVASLAPPLMDRYELERPTILRPSTVESQGTAGTSTIVTGYSVFIEDRTQFRFFIVMVVPVVMLIPVFDQFDVYEVFDTPECERPRTVIATARGSKRLDGVTTRVGGMIGELHFDDEAGNDHGYYLAVAYYMPFTRIAGRCGWERRQQASDAADRAGASPPAAPDSLFLRCQFGP